MKTYLDCIPCFLNQALRAARISGANDKLQKKVLDKLIQMMTSVSLDNSPPEIGRIVYKTTSEVTGVEDPFEDIKKKCNKKALAVYPKLKEKVAYSKDKLLTALELAALGNAIDLGKYALSDSEEETSNILKISDILNIQNQSIFDYEKFKKALDSTDQILYLADNAGETVFDRILIEELDKEVIFAVRDKPIINDALLEDAKFCGIDKIARVISSGSDAPGTILNLCSKDFLDIFKKADLIISKGQGNFESLENENAPIFFLFKVKCPVVANYIGSKVGEIVLKSNLK